MWRRYHPWGAGNVFRELDALRREVDRVFSDSFGRADRGAQGEAGAFPVNLYASDDALVLTAEVPGVEPSALELALEDDLLSIAFERPQAAQADKPVALRRERAHGRFARTVELPLRVDPERVAARVDRGVLQVQMPRLEADKPRKINVATQ